MSSEDLSTTSKEITTYHRLIEAMKFAFAEKMKEGDPDFIEADKFDFLKVLKIHKHIYHLFIGNH